MALDVATAWWCSLSPDSLCSAWHLWHFWDAPSAPSCNHVTSISPSNAAQTWLSTLLSPISSHKRKWVFWKCRWPLAERKQARKLDSYHFSFSLPCYLSPHPCRACWQELINLFMGWTELAPIIQGVELLSGGNKRLYPLPICPPVTLCPVFGIPWSCVLFVLVIVVYS